MALFKDRAQAGEQLYIALKPFIDRQTVLMAVPRGAVAVAYPVARQAGLPLDLLMSKKIGHPLHPEFAIGAVTTQGYVLEITEGVPAHYVTGEIEKIRQYLKDKHTLFTEGKQPQEITDKTVIIIDDGLATGSTMISAVGVIRDKLTKRIIVAVPVAPSDTVDRGAKIADMVVVLYTPSPFENVGRHYEAFPQLTDMDVIGLLKKING